jgi:site-specific DNA recombinase
MRIEMKAALYARVSSEKQAEKDLSISAQLKALRKYADEHGYQVFREFIDEAESARTADRPAFQEMIAYAKQKSKPFEAILVWKLSRFARNREDSIVFKSLLRKVGVQVISISEQFDDSPVGRLLESLIESMDEFYSANLSQEARRGLREVASRGFWAAGSAPFGYRLIDVPDGKATRKNLDIDEISARIVRKMFDLCLQGRGAKDIAQTLNREGIETRSGGKWTKAGVAYMLKNDIYTGDFVWPSLNRLRKGEKQIVHERHHDPIISKKDFERAQEMISDRAPERIHPQRLVSSYLLSGLLFCDKCGKAMLGATAKSGRYRYYSCYSRTRVDLDCCKCKPINSDKLERTVVDKLKEHVLTESNLSELLRLTNAELADQSKRLSKDVESWRLQLSKVQIKLERLFDAVELGHLSAASVAPRIDKLKLQMDDLQSRISVSESDRERRQPVKAISKAELKRYVVDLRALLLEGEFFEQKSFLRSFVKRIDYGFPQVQIEYTFPLDPKTMANREVLAMGKKSGADEARTRDLLRDRQAF